MIQVKKLNLFQMEVLVYFVIKQLRQSSKIDMTDVPHIDEYVSTLISDTECVSHIYGCLEKSGRQAVDAVRLLANGISSRGVLAQAAKVLAEVTRSTGVNEYVLTKVVELNNRTKVAAEDGTTKRVKIKSAKKTKEEDGGLGNEQE